MEYMFENGFLGTRAPFFMDFVTLIVAILPFLMVGVIYFAKIKKYKVHQIANVVLFIVSVIVVTYFEAGVRFGGGFNSFIKDSGVSHNYALIVLVLHIIIAVATLFVWVLALTRAKKYLREKKHKQIGKITFIGVVLTSLSGIWVYMLLFVY
jgi:putative membrane protein